MVSRLPCQSYANCETIEDREQTFRMSSVCGYLHFETRKIERNLMLKRVDGNF